MFDMTRDQVISRSGPPLSEAVAQHVMRWQRVPQSEVANRMGSVWTDEKGNWRLIPRQPLRPGDAKLFAIVAEVWEPHRDMKAAWMVWMAAPGEKKTLQIHEGRISAEIDAAGLIEAEAPELAICRVALLAAAASQP